MKFGWRENRGYMLCQSVSFDSSVNETILQGFWKGASMNCNQLVHITGHHNYQIQSIQILKKNDKEYQIVFQQNSDQQK
jgi:hypothetical protein